MKQFPIVQLSPDQIRVDPRNVYRHSDAEIQRLVGVISAHGNLSTITIDAESMKIEDGRETFELVGGEARLEAYKSLSVETIPAIMATFETPAQRSAAAVALNGPYGSFDDAALGELLRELAAESYDTDLSGLPPFQIEELLAGTTEVMPPDGFASYDEDLKTDYECPKCHYSWSGKPNSGAE